MSSVLFDWIRDSNSWKNAKSLDVLDRQESEYHFLKRSDDFYISLFNRMFKALKNDTYVTEQTQQELLSIAKGLELYSSNNTREDFFGVNYSENILYAASIYYLTGYYSTSTLLAKMFDTDDYDFEVDQFIHAFLSVNRNIDNSYMHLLNKFLESGNPTILNDIIQRINKELETSDPYKYAPLLLAKNLLRKFSENNLWKSFMSANPSIDWKEFILNKINDHWVLFPSQELALKKGLLIKNESFSLQMPTSSGKTALCEIIIYNEVKYKRNKVLLLAPFRALASELKYAFTKKFKNLGITVKTLYGGHISTREEKEEIDKVDLLICTPEKFMAIENNLPNIQDFFSTIICDEGHLLDDEQRGLNYELLLAKFKSNRNFPEKKYIYISAIIPNIETINNWLGGNQQSLVKSNYRPTQLSYGFLVKNNNEKGSETFSLDIYSTKNELISFTINDLLDVQKDYKYTKISTGNINTYKYKTIKARAVSVALRSLNSGCVALFTPQKGVRGVKGLADEVIKQVELLTFPNPLNFSLKEKIQDLTLYFKKIFGEEYILTKSIQHGFAIHHGDLPQFVREIIEKCIRDRIVPLVICTNTLAEGVNLPIKTLVLHSVKRFNYHIERLELIRKRDIKNIVGRAGRAGQEVEGLIISVNPSEYQYINEVMFEEEIELVRGHLYNIINDISETLKGNRLSITNDQIEDKDEEFKRLIDSIDKSIIDLLFEEVTDENINQIIEPLINKTYSYFQSNEEGKQTLEYIFKLRSSTLTPYIKDGKIKILKESNTTARIYDDILTKIDIDNHFWTDSTAPFTEEFISHMLNIALSLEHVQYDLDQFKKRNGIELSSKELTKILVLWMKGKWYDEISIELKVEVDIVLRIFLFIESIICPLTTKVISIIKSKLLENGKLINKDIEDVSLFFQYGFKDRIYLILIDLGFSERMSTLALGQWIIRNFQTLDLSDRDTIEMILIQNKVEIIEYLSHTVPKVALDAFRLNLSSIV